MPSLVAKPSDEQPGATTFTWAGARETNHRNHLLAYLCLPASKELPLQQPQMSRHRHRTHRRRLMLQPKVGLQLLCASSLCAPKRDSPVRRSEFIFSPPFSRVSITQPHSAGDHATATLALEREKTPGRRSTTGNAPRANISDLLLYLNLTRKTRGAEKITRPGKPGCCCCCPQPYRQRLQATRYRVCVAGAGPLLSRFGLVGGALDKRALVLLR